MRDPSTVMDTMNNFEYRAIHNWVIKKGKRRDPQTRCKQFGFLFCWNLL
jgi:hypothetical protein